MKLAAFDDLSWCINLLKESDKNFDANLFIIQL